MTEAYRSADLEQLIEQYRKEQRNETIEECAQVVEGWFKPLATGLRIDNLLAAIRALKS